MLGSREDEAAGKCRKDFREQYAMEKEFQKSNRSPLESVEYRVVLMQDYTAHSQGKHDGRATS